MIKIFKYGLSITVLALSIFIYTFFPKNNNNPHKFFIIIDAGSTGTRLHYFELINIGSSTDPTKWSISNETVYFVSPGFSSFTENVTKISESIKSLISQIRHRIDIAEDIPVYLGATAGLRLLGDEDAKLLLNEAKSQLKKEPNLRLLEGGVKLLDGETEGLLAWHGMMYLLSKSRNGKSSCNSKNPAMIGSIDLGGASVQVTIKKENNKKVFINSFLGLGLKSARLSMLMNSLYTIKDYVEFRGVDGNGNRVIVSSCLTEGFRGHWTHHIDNYTLIGVPNSQSPEEQFNSCYHAANKVIEKHFNETISDQFLDLYRSNSSNNQDKEDSNKKLGDNQKEVHFYLFGYLYDRMKDICESTLKISKLNQTSILTIDDYGECAKYACQNREVDHLNPFQCADVVYLYALLKDGLKFTNKIQLYVVKSINGIQLGWPLGKLLEILTNINNFD